jgi:hypothetical protein
MVARGIMFSCTHRSLQLYSPVATLVATGEYTGEAPTLTRLP